MITERDIQILKSVAEYYVLDRAQIQAIHGKPGETAARHLRQRLHDLRAQGWLNATGIQVGPRSPTHLCYYPSRKGAQLLAEFFSDEKYLTTTTQCPQQHCLFHWLAISDTHIRINQAIALQQEATVARWVNEWDVTNPQESIHRPERRFYLYTLLSERPRLICAPDWAMLLSIGKSKVFYGEEDRASDSAERYINGKVKGYAALADRKLHKKHFPEATIEDFTVLMFSPDRRRRDALRFALRGKAGAHLWRFAAKDELTPENLLTEPVFFPVEGEPGSLTKKKVVTVGGTVTAPGRSLQVQKEAAT